MGRPKDKHYWNQVTKEKNGNWKCKHCRHEFSGRISISRIKAHVDRKKGQGTAICSIDRDHEGVHNDIASSSSNPQEGVNRVQVAECVPETIDTSISGSINHHTEFVPSLEGWSGSSRIKSAFESEINHLNQLIVDLRCEETDIEGQVQWLQSRGKKRKRQVDIWLQELQELKRRGVDMNNLRDLFVLPDSCGVEIKQLIEKMLKHKENNPMVLSTEFVGITFEKNINKVWKLLADEQVFIIGIYGMGGVGKTLLVSHMENEIKRKGTFKDVFWVTVSHNFSISRLQHDIAKKMGLKLDEDEERTRATNLSLALEAKEKSVIILDDVWQYIDFQKVGIPLKVNGIKVILTTRLKQVCQQMDCLSINMITMLPLNDADDHDDEALELFMLKLGHNGTPATLPPKVLKFAKSIVKTCNGLPLAISVMARTMKGVDNIHRWKHVWNKLKELEWGEDMEEVFKILKRSYDNLMEKDMQNCFLYSALLFDFGRDELIMKLTDNGLISGRRSLEEIFDEGRTIMDILEAHSLLGTGSLSITHPVWHTVTHAVTHRLVTDMACHILEESQRYVMVKHKTWPHMQHWTTDLELVYLNHCDIKQIPEGMSPCCP